MALARCLYLYVLLIAVVAVTAVVVRFVPAGPLANALTVPVIGSLGAAGLIGVLLVDRARFPRMLDPSATRRWRFTIPVMAGAAFGVVTIAHALISPGRGPTTPFPVAILVFASGGILLEIMLRLFGTTVPVALFAGLGPRARSIAFWIAASLTALYEPLPYFQGHALTWSAGLIAARLFAFNLLAAVFYRKAGFLAALTERWSEYVVWHIIGQCLFELH